mmetsp:Transcript_63494/g.176626  ORF Transcript_63494/g.176626 Transcript_63494/m.176626 type:complete len:310 (+) Transcript_63494:1357-2286(+)
MVPGRPPRDLCNRLWATLQPQRQGIFSRPQGPTSSAALDADACGCRPQAAQTVTSKCLRATWRARARRKAAATAEALGAAAIAADAAAAAAAVPVMTEATAAAAAAATAAAATRGRRTKRHLSAHRRSHSGAKEKSTGGVPGVLRGAAGPAAARAVRIAVSVALFSRRRQKGQRQRRRSLVPLSLPRRQEERASMRASSTPSCRRRRSQRQSACRRCRCHGLPCARAIGSAPFAAVTTSPGSCVVSGATGARRHSRTQICRAGASPTFEPATGCVRGAATITSQSGGYATSARCRGEACVRSSNIELLR